ncbi:S8 family serine peptidase [Algoriphagus sp. CAU 1675]|uniref:S8 family peptidase n=1 Tax=Algoriphagus sp. CAU 1675 TaxID=3032597 RepID=UPI0023DC5F76|nr:S8 family serine peptidase [Algoriphagus sp. CAU 1675]MDF2156816.1 S8 family serine peptidase [Algoriphagus sp. CAU 1675]
MKKLLFFLFLIVFSSEGFSQNQNFVVVFKDSFEQPVRINQRRNSNRETQASQNEISRNQKLDRVDDFLGQKNVATGRAKKFVDGAVGFVAALSPAEVQKIKSDPAVDRVVEDFTMQGRPRMQGTRPRMQGESLGDLLYNEQTKSSCAIPLMGGAQESGLQSSIWVVDTGVDAGHRDLNVSRNRNFATSFVDNEPNPFDDGAGHGTHCAGLAAGTGAGDPGITGMSPGAEIISLKILDRNGMGNWSSLVLALDHIEKYGVAGDVVMMSLGASVGLNCSNFEPFLNEMIVDLGSKGIFIVMSAGNDSAAANENLPGCINGPNVFTVGAMSFSCEALGVCSSLSNLGNPPIDWFAPGDNLISTFPGNQYQVMSGTSMAAALVAGVIHSKGGTPRAIQQVSCGGLTYSVAGR